MKIAKQAYTTELVLHLDRVMAQPVLDAGALNAGGQTALHLLRQFRRHLLAQEMHDLRRLHRNNGFPREGFVEELHDRGRTEGQIGRTRDLHQAPAVSLGQDVEDRTALTGVVIQNPVQDVWGRTVCQLLHLTPVANAEEGVVGHRIIDVRRHELPGEPTVAVAVKLQAERAPGRHAQIDQPQLGIDEVKVVMQALVRCRPQKGLVGALVMPRLVGRAGFHDRDHMDQSRMIAMRLGDVLNRHTSRSRQCLSVRPDAFMQRLDKARIAKDADLLGVQAARHACRVARARQRAGNHYPVIAGQNPRDPVMVALKKRCVHGNLHFTWQTCFCFNLFGSGSFGLGAWRFIFLRPQAAVSQTKT